MPIQIVKADAPASARSGRGRRRWVTVLAIAQLFVTVPVLAFGVLLFGHFRYQTPPLERIGLYVLAVEMAESMRNARFPIRHWLGLSDDFPTLYLDIKQKHYRKLEYVSQHDAAVAEGMLGEELRREVEVPAQIRLDDESVPVKVRLKGDRAIHFATPDRWSLRVKTRGEATVFGMKRFSLQKPLMRNYLYEWFFHETLRHEGLIGLRYRFVNLHVNGKPAGIYAVEEHFEKRMLEANQRREAPILKFEEKASHDISTWYAMAVTPFSGKRWEERDPEMLQQAIYLLEAFRDGRLEVQEVFDVELLARYFALIDLLDMPHGALAKSLRFYYNPISAKLEPVGFDAHFYGRKFPVLTSELSDFREPRGYSMPAWYEALFGPPIANKIEFYEAYVRELERISRPEFLDTLFADIEPELERNLDFIYSEIPFVDTFTGHPRTTGGKFLFYFAKHKFYERQLFIQKRLRPIAALTAYIESVDPDRIVLQLGNAQKFPIEVLDVVHGGRRYTPAAPLVLEEKSRYDPISYSRLELLASGEIAAPPPKDPNVVEAEPLTSAIRYRIPGSSWVGQRRLFSWTLAEARMPAPDRNHPYVDVPELPFLRRDDETRTLHVLPGRFSLDEDVVIPGGWTVRGGPGTALDLRSGARLTSHSPLEILATETDPFRIFSSDGTGQGLLVTGVASRSKLRHVHFEGLSLPENPALKITSVVTFHRSDVTIESCSFEGNDSEDALNVIQSSYEIRDSVFTDTAADAFDSDFSDGRVESSRFVRIGNDAIDVSGSQVTLRHVRIEGTGDKGISVGEASRMEAEYLWVSGTTIAIAVKDRSNFDGMTLDIRDSKVGFALFQKKPEYGPASADVWRTVFSGTDETHWLEYGSELNYDGAPVAANRSDLKALLYADEAPATL